MELQSVDGPPPARQGVQLDRPQRIALAAKLIQRVSKPAPVESPHRLSAYYRSLAFADFDAMLADAKMYALIEPCFEDWSWLFGDRDASVMFMEIPPLQAAAAIDLNWTEALIDDLFDSHLKEHPSRKLEVLYGVINSLAK